MNIHNLRGKYGPAPRVLMMMLAACALHADTTVTVQNGVNGYSGTTDFSVNTQYAQYNGGNGVRWTGAQMGCYPPRARTHIRSDIW